MNSIIEAQMELRWIRAQRNLARLALKRMDKPDLLTIFNDIVFGPIVLWSVWREDDWRAIEIGVAISQIQRRKKTFLYVLVIKILRRKHRRFIKNYGF